MFGDFNVAKKDMMSGFMFYVMQIVMLAGISTVLIYGMTMAGMTDAKTAGDFFTGGHLHTIIGSVFTLWLGGSILHKRGETNNITSFAIVAVGVYLAYTSSVFLGLVPIALLTTMGTKK